MSEDRPVLDTIAAMTMASLENTSLGAREVMLSRIAALAASGAPAVSYLANVGAAVDSGVTLEDAQGVLTAIAPIIGTARTVTAAANISRALGFVILAIEEELQAELEAESD
jgi:alkylhydroperoxidase/carboxymuconolactone decarboxylase family protein YurZ